MNLDKVVGSLIPQIKFIAFDFDGVFTDNFVYVAENGMEMIRCSRQEGLGLKKLKKLGIKTAIISSEKNPVVSVRSRKLKIDCYQDCVDKKKVLNDLLEKHGLNLKQAAFVGNDINDLECLKAVAFPIVVNDSHPDVIPFAKFRTKNVGGNGAVREICDLFEHVLLTTPNSK